MEFNIAHGKRNYSKVPERRGFGQTADASDAYGFLWQLFHREFSVAETINLLDRSRLTVRLTQAESRTTMWVGMMQAGSTFSPRSRASIISAILRPWASEG